MIAVIQRVTHARVDVAGQTLGQIGPGVLALVAICKDDTDADIAWMTRKLICLRIFRGVAGGAGGEKHFDQDIQQIGGSILLISNFTISADTRSGRRPSLDSAASPDQAAILFEKLLQSLRATAIRIATGRFGANMRITLTNDGPATFLLDSRG